MDYCKKFIVKEDDKLDLSKINPNEKGDYKGKKEAKAKMKENIKKLTELQYKLYSENKQSILVVLQALDAAGKDGTINHVFAPLNPQGCRVHGFKAPTQIELAHDFLWRIHKETPGKGEIVIFNRSHYEDVLITRVHKLISQKECEMRYKYINDFEKLLTDNNTKIIKIYLHISKEEQLKRFKKRLDTPKKHWKISDGDYKERQLWNDYTGAFENAINACSQKDAPWYVIPANHKWYRNLVVSEIMVETMENMKLKLPEPTVDINEIRKLAEREESK